MVTPWHRWPRARRSSIGFPCAGRATNKLYVPAAGTTPSKVSSFWTVVRAANLHSRFVGVVPPLGNGKTISVLSWLSFSQSERRCRDGQRTLLLHESLFKGTCSLGWEYSCSVRQSTPQTSYFSYECMIQFIRWARHPGPSSLSLHMRSVGFVSAGLSRHDFAAYQANFARQRFSCAWAPVCRQNWSSQFVPRVQGGPMCSSTWSRERLCSSCNLWIPGRRI